MKSTILILFTLFVIPNFVAAQKSQYIGYKFKSVLMEELLPNGVKALGGSLITEVDAQRLLQSGDTAKAKYKCFGSNSQQVKTKTA